MLCGDKEIYNMKTIMFNGKKYEAIREGKIFFEGKTQELGIYQIPLNEIFYNVANGRIGTYVNDYNLKNPNRKLEEIFKDDINEFNDIIEKFILSSDRSNRFNKTKESIRERGQQLNGVILSDGTILDGNRRYTSLRQLCRETSYGKYQYFETMIIDKRDDDELRKKSIKMLEIQLQHGQDEKVDYSPIQMLVDIYNNVVKVSNGSALLTDKEYYMSAEYKKNEYLKLKNRMEIMVDFCDYFSMPENFSIVDDLKLDGPINEISNFKNKLKKDGALDKYEDKYKPLIYSILLSFNSGDTSRMLRDLLKTYDTGYLDDLATNQENYIEEIYDKMRKSPSGNENMVISEIKNYEKSKKLLNDVENSVFNSKQKSKQGETLANVNDAINKISNIDSSEFSYMPKDKLGEVESAVRQLRNITNSLLDDLNDVK